MPLRPDANRARGEVIASLAGDPRRLCLTLGALAEIETGLALDSASAIAERLRAPAARDLLVILAALLRGGGEIDLAERAADSAIDPAEAAAAIAAAFVAAAG